MKRNYVGHAWFVKSKVNEKLEIPAFMEEGFRYPVKSILEEDSREKFNIRIGRDFYEVSSECMILESEDSYFAEISKIPVLGEVLKLYNLKLYRGGGVEKIETEIVPLVVKKLGSNAWLILTENGDRYYSLIREEIEVIGQATLLGQTKCSDIPSIGDSLEMEAILYSGKNPRTKVVALNSVTKIKEIDDSMIKVKGYNRNARVTAYLALCID